MKTNFVLAILCSLFFNCVSAQTIQTCITEGFSSQTSGWTYSQGAHIGDYTNPAAGCADDRGIITPGVGGNNPCNIQTPEYTSTGATSVGLTFDIIVLNANLKCNTWKDYACQTSVDVFYYIAGTKYTGILDKVLPPNGPGNSTLVSMSFEVGNNLPAGTVYKIEFCFKPKSGVGNCIQQNTKYVFDNFRNCETVSRNNNAEIIERSANISHEIMPEGTFTVSPNPTRGATKITANAGMGIKTISLIDNNGKVIRSVSGATFIMFDLKGLSNGKYFVQFESENGDQVRKVVTIN